MNREIIFDRLLKTYDDRTFDGVFIRCLQLSKLFFGNNGEIDKINSYIESNNFVNKIIDFSIKNINNVKLCENYLNTIEELDYSGTSGDSEAKDIVDELINQLCYWSFVKKYTPKNILMNYIDKLFIDCIRLISIDSIGYYLKCWNYSKEYSKNILECIGNIDKKNKKLTDSDIYLYSQITYMHRGQI